MTDAADLVRRTRQNDIRAKLVALADRAFADPAIAAKVLADIKNDSRGECQYPQSPIPSPALLRIAAEQEDIR